MKDQNNLNLFKSKELEIDKAKTIDEEILKEYVPLTKEQYNYLEKNHGFLESVASYYGLLYSPKERRVVIPVRDKEGNLVSIRRWLLPEHRKEKNDQEKILGYIYQYRKGHPFSNIEGKSVLLIDEGSETGVKLTTALKSVLGMKPKAVYIAAPILPTTVIENLEPFADELFFAYNIDDYVKTTLYYRHLPDVSEERIEKILGENIQ